MIKQKFSKIKSNIKRYGLLKTMRRILFQIFKIKQKNSKSAKQIYQKWILQNEPKEEELEEQKKEEFEVKPKISIIVPMYQPDENFFLELLNSLFAQTYSNWELCIADGSKEQNETIFAMCSRCSKIKYQFLGENKGISGNTNCALEMADGDFIAFLDHDDCLPPFSFYEIVKAIQKNPEVDFIYSDEDKIDDKGERFDPYFKPDFSPETLECHNYITHFVVVRKEWISQIGKLDSRFDGAQDFDFVLRVAENTKNIVHIPKILYHWRAHPNSTASVANVKEYAYEAGKKAIEEHLKRTGKKGSVENPNEVPGIYQIKYEVKGNPSVSIIILDKNDKKMLKRCLKTILTMTTYKNYEVCILSNDEQLKTKIPENPKVKIISEEENIKNMAGEFIVYLDCYAKLLTPDWLQLLLGYAQNEEIGVVGTRVLDQHKSIQNIGISYEIAENTEDLLKHLPSDLYGYFGQEVATRNVKTVSNVCFMTRKEIYEEGFSNEVDFCLKILEKGYRVVYNPYVELIHDERNQK